MNYAKNQPSRAERTLTILELVPKVASYLKSLYLSGVEAWMEDTMAWGEATQVKYRRTNDHRQNNQSDEEWFRSNR